MSVIGADQVEAAAACGVLQVQPRDLVTPLAQERARELGVQIVVATPGAAASITRAVSASAGQADPARQQASPQSRPLPARARRSPIALRSPQPTSRHRSRPGGR